VYTDELVIEYLKGELHPEYGIYVGRPFGIVSGMGKGRYVDLNGDNVVINKKNWEDSQKWFFDGKSKTIKSFAKQNKSWNIMT